MLEDITPNAAQMLTEAGFTVRTHLYPPSEDELIQRVADCTLLGVRWKTQVTERVLAAAPRLLAIGAYCVGTDTIALRAAAERGITVFNAPFSNTRSVVEFTIAHMIMLLRQIGERNAQTHAGMWDESATKCYEMRGKTLGIVGYGRIGAQLSVVAEALGMRVIFYDIAYRPAFGNARSTETLHDVLQHADIVSLHVDGRPENTNLISAKELAMMKPGAYLVNVSRGAVVDIRALAESLISGHLAGAALDVFPTEPLHGDTHFSTPLHDLPNVILTPHIAGATEEAEMDIGAFVTERLIEYVRTGSMDTCENMPAYSQWPASVRDKAATAYMH